MKRLKYIFYFYCLFVIFINTAHSENYSLEKAFDGLNRPWGMSFIDDHNLLVTQKSGEIIKINLKTQEKIELDHNLKVLEVGWQGGMLDVLYHDGVVYVSYTEKRYGKHTTTSIAAGKLVNDRLENFKNIFRSDPPVDTDIHWGSRLAVKDNYLFASVGERAQGMAAQDPTNHFGTIIRLNLDGSIPKSNPGLTTNKDWLPEIYQIGVRNPQGMAVSPVDNEVYITNHGPKGGDFFGKVIKGSNYGWMLVAWGGTDYDGSIIGDGSAWKPGLLKPIYKWIPSIAVSNMIFYQGEKFPELNNKVLVTSLKAQKLISLDYKNDKVINEQVLYEREGRMRDVEFNSKGEIFIIIDDSKSGIWKLIRK